MINLTRLNNIMSLQYVNVIFTIKIEHQIKFLTYPVFIFRSVIGKELHLMACLFRNRTCEECPLKFTCPYSFLFETHVLKDNDIIKGRNKASHPFVLSSSAKYGEIRDNLDLNVTLFGKGIKYLPYFYYAIKRAGEKGIFKERVKYSILDAKVNNKSIIKNPNMIDTDIERNKWQFNNNDSTDFKKRFFITLLSPLRLKSKGIYKKDLNFKDILIAAERRAEILLGLYGSENSENNEEISTLRSLSLNCLTETEKADLLWHDLPYYSSRQRLNLKMGGVSGSLEVTAIVNESILSLLKGAEIFHIGKNSIFGLGKIRIENIKV